MNINELTAKLKAAAQEEIMCRETCDTCDLWQDEASPENVLALTEALEAAEKRVAEYRVALNNLAAVARRFLPDYDEHPDIQVADDLLEREELEVRTLSVKLPKASRVKLVSGEYVHGWRAYDVTCAISNAGIKLQIEGE